MKKPFSLLLVLALCLSLFPAAFAEEPVGALAPDVQEEGGEDTSSGADAPPSPQGEGETAEPDALPPAEDEADALPPAADEIQDTVASGECGDSMIWTLNSEGVLTIAGSGDMWNWDTDYAPWYDHREEIKSIRIMSGVTNIGNFAFDGCTSLTSVTIPEGVTGIGNLAFYGCTSLTSVMIPEDVASIGSRAFYGCSAMTSISIPASAVTIGSEIFWACGNLKNVYYGGTKAAWYLCFPYERSGFTVHCTDGDLEPASDNQCGENLLWTVDDAGNMTIAGSGRMWNYGLNNNAFYTVKTLRILSGVTSIGNHAFRDCSSLTSVQISESVTTIGDSAFLGCSSLTSLTIPTSVINVEKYAFAWSVLEELRFEGAAPSLGENCFSDVTATAYYPANDPTWTEDVRQNYGGTITWVAYESESAYTPGDINGAGALDNADVTQLIFCIKYGSADATGASLDVNGDGELDNRDVTRLIRCIHYGGVDIF